MTWSHYVELIPLKDINKINFFINLSINLNLTRDQLREKIKRNEYERLNEETRNKIINKEELSIKELVPNPIIINNKNNIEVVSEKVLHKLILEDIENFMRELGSRYSFVSGEYKIKIGNVFNYIDLLLFNYQYNCFIVVELKSTKLKKEHIGQLEIYLNYVNKNLKNINMNESIGIIICKKDNRFIIEYTTDKRIIARFYEIK